MSVRCCCSFFFIFFSLYQYTMLSGKTPFQTYSRETSAALIMQRIREGEFRFSGPQWKVVSTEAKEVIRGLLTVDSHKRFTMQQLRHHPWVQASHPLSTPLMTPNILCSLASPRAAETAVNATLHAFHKATRDGFRLLDVSAAPLAQRRKQKLSSTDSSLSSDISSSRTSYSCFSSSEKEGCQQRSSGASKDTNSVFDYSEERVTDYLSTLPDITKTELPQEWPSRTNKNDFHRPTTRSYKRKKAVATSQSDDDCVVVAEVAPVRQSLRKAKRPNLIPGC